MYHFIGIIMAVFLILALAGTFLAIYKPILYTAIKLWATGTLYIVTLAAYIVLCIWLIVH
jgi:hypothetical protein